MATSSETGNDNGQRFVEVICSICAGLTVAESYGLEPVCIACLINGAVLCAVCGARAESICGTCGDWVCGSVPCLAVHEHESASETQ